MACTGSIPTVATPTTPSKCTVTSPNTRPASMLSLPATTKANTSLSTAEPAPTSGSPPTSETANRSLTKRTAARCVSCATSLPLARSPSRTTATTPSPSTTLPPTLTTTPSSCSATTTSRSRTTASTARATTSITTTARTKCSILGGRAPRLLTRRRGRIDYPSSIWPPSKSTETWNSAFTSEESASANLHLPPSFCPSLLFLLLLLIQPLSIQPTHHSFFFPPSSRKLPSSVSSSSSPTLLHILGLSGADSSSTDVA